ncbi:hypothetical protein, partial [Yersinia pestis]
LIGAYEKPPAMPEDIYLTYSALLIYPALSTYSALFTYPALFTCSALSISSTIIFTPIKPMPAPVK